MKKNILMILTDQHTYTTLSTYGTSVCHTPHLDQLAMESIVFDRAYTVCPICTPARASIQTGVYPSKHGMVTNIYTKGCIVHELPDSEHLLSRRLIEQGYLIGYTGKWHLGAGRNRQFLGGVEYPWIAELLSTSGLPSDVGYEGDDFPGHGGIGDQYEFFHQYLKQKGKVYQTNILHEGYPRASEITSGLDTAVPHFLVDQAIQKLDDFKNRQKPYFYMLNFWQPHEPYDVPTEFLDRYRDLELDPWETFSQDTEQLPMIHQVERGMKGDWNKIQQFIRYYYAAITQIDYEIGRLFDYLKQSNLYENTVIIFSADHGETLGVHAGLTDKGLDMFEETVHIPLYLKIPGVKPRRQQHLVQTCDLYSTVLDIAGAKRELIERDGQSLLRTLEEESWRHVVVSESSGLDFMSYTQRMIRDDRYKFVFHVGDKDELYDLLYDPHETTNLSIQRDYATRCISMLHELKRWLIDHHDGLLIRYDNIMHAKIERYEKMIRHE